MVTMTKHKETTKYVEYKFFPEGKEDYGILRVYKNNKHGYIVKEPDKETADNYSRHAYFVICDCIDRQEYPDVTGCAWY